MVKMISGMNAARQPRQTQADDFRPINDQGRDTFRWSDPLLLAFTFIFQPLINGVYMLCKLSIVADADPRIAKLPKSCLQFVVGCGLRMPLASRCFFPGCFTLTHETLHQKWRFRR